MNGKAFGSMVRQVTSECLSRWYDTSNLFPRFKERFSRRQKSAKERELEGLLRNIPVSLEIYDGLPEAERLKARRTVRTLVARSLIRTENALTRQFFDQSEWAAERFVREARAFDPSIRERDIHQALRNLWVFNSIQLHLAHPISLTRSSFAYSLLYPYTDNWLDEAGGSDRAQEVLLHWLTLRLQGRHLEAPDWHTVAVDRLLRMIEEDYPRPAFPGVYDALLAIHDAQANSLQLHHAPAGRREEDLLRLTVEKGGTSVLADGFLVSGTLTAVQVRAVFGFGVLLQLVDDLQDLDEDGGAGHWSPFLNAAGTGTLEGITNRLFNFAREIAASLEDPPPAQDGQLSQLIEQSVTFLIMETVARHQALYGGRYLRMLDEFTPVRLSYLELLRRRLKKTHTPPGISSASSARVSGGKAGVLSSH